MMALILNLPGSSSPSSVAVQVAKVARTTNPASSNNSTTTGLSMIGRHDLAFDFSDVELVYGFNFIRI